jgi:NADP-dependent 3-hydroxy acid dehydrogenase YdfG
MEGVNMTDLTDKVVIITGASSGIGEATAKELASQGAKIGLVARREDRLDSLKQAIEETGGTALVIAADVTDQAHAKKVVKQVIDAWGQIDILINNAGVMLLGPVIDAPMEEWETMIHVNLLGLMYLTHQVTPLMKRQGSGHIINISSVAGRTTRSGSAVYNATKWGVNAFTDALRQELAEGKTGIRTTLIEPGAVATELQSHNRPEIREQLKQRFGDMKLLQPEDVAAAIAYAATQPAHVSINEILIRPTEQPL